MTKDKHTPTPWSLEKDFDFILSDYKKDKVVCRFFDQDEEPYINYVANAARIVQCVNEYDGLIETIATIRAEKAELIEALRDARTVLYVCENFLLNCGYGVESSTIKSIQKASEKLSKLGKP